MSDAAMTGSQDITIRSATPEDRSDIERLVAALQNDGRRYDPALAAGEPVFAKSSVDAMNAYVADDQGLCLVALLDGRVVGYVGCSLEVDDDIWTDPDWTRSVHVQELFVDPAARRRGIARRLVGEVERHALKLGVKRMLVMANARNPESCGSYRAMGFSDYKVLFEKLLPTAP
ncbi:MAG: GNAT family N-acetyltransferase [Pseudomonadota bacterium]